MGCGDTKTDSSKTLEQKQIELARAKGEEWEKTAYAFRNWTPAAREAFIEGVRDSAACYAVSQKIADVLEQSHTTISRHETEAKADGLNQKEYEDVAAA